MSDDAMATSRLRRRSRALLSVPVLGVAFLVAACSVEPSVPGDAGESPALAEASGESDSTPPDSIPTVTPEPTARVSEAASAPSASTAPPRSTPDPSVTPTPTPHPITEIDTELPRAPIGLDAIADAVSTPDGPRPVVLEIADIGIGRADVIAVGVNPDESFEVPPADQVGWYRFGPTPGAAGSAVLAAHIAFNGMDGVFRHLADVEVGAIVEVGFDDDTTMRYRIEDVTDYRKEKLPASLWSQDGPPQLVLITCGGTFDTQLRSYESNTVAIAVPI